MNRRAFVFGLAALPLAASLGSMPAQPVDEYALFLERVRLKVVEIVRREGRGIRHAGSRPGMWIDPPRAVGNVYVRKVHLQLEIGGSLLDKNYFEFDVVSGSRWGGV